MKNFLVRLLLAAALTLVTFALASPAQAQQADEDPVTKMSYQLDDQSKAKPYIGKQVIGKLEMKSNTIHIDSIEPLS